MEVLLLKLGEMVLKGLNRGTFEEVLKKNLRRLKRVGRYEVSCAQSTVYVTPLMQTLEDGTQVLSDVDEAERICRKVFGVISIARAAVVEKDYDKIVQTALEYAADELNRVRTFKVEARRSDKKFPMDSPQICRELGAKLLQHFGHLKVDIHNPDAVVCVEVRETAAYVHCGNKKAAGGLPTGTSGKGMVLISGGLDSPIAAYRMARRGQVLDAVHFVSPPYTGEQAMQKVIDLLNKVAEYSGRINLHVVPFTEIQEQIAQNCAEDYFTIIMRRFMMRLATEVAKRSDSECLITGESLGQVASQTIGAIACTDEAAGLPVFRPLIGSDKQEIVETAHHIGTYDISILPYEDCCTVFTPRHPRLRPTLEEIREAEAALDIEGLCARALEGVYQIHLA